MTTFTKTGNFLCFQHFNISFRAYTLYDVTKIEVIDSYKEGKDRIRLILDKEVMCSEPYDRNLSPDYMKFLTHCVAFPDLIQDLDNGTYYLEEDKLKKSSKKNILNISSIKLLQVDLENPLDSLIEIPDLKMIIQLYKLLTFEKANAPDTRENKDNKYFWVHFKSDLRRSVDYENHYKAMQSMHNFCVEISQLKNHVNLGKPLESFFK